MPGLRFLDPFSLSFKVTTNCICFPGWTPLLIVLECLHTMAFFLLSWELVSKPWQVCHCLVWSLFEALDILESAQKPWNQIYQVRYTPTYCDNHTVNASYKNYLSDPSRTPYPMSFSTALFSFVYHFACFEVGKSAALCWSSYWVYFIRVLNYFLKLNFTLIVSSFLFTGNDALVSSGLVESLLRVIEYSGDDEHLTVSLKLFFFGSI